MSWSKEAEQSVLGACMLDELAYEAVSDTGITADDFHSAQHRIIWSAIESVAKAGDQIDVLSVVESLRAKGASDDAGGIEYVSYLVDVTPSSDGAATYAGIVKEWSRKRQLRTLGETVSMMIADGESPDDVQEYAGSELMRLESGRSLKTSHGAGALLKAAVAELQSRFDGAISEYKTGLSDLDDILRIEGGRCTMIAGRPGMGKSAMANRAIIQSCMDGVPVLCFTMEMPGVEVMNRLICSVGRLDNSFMQNPKGYQYQSEAWDKLAAATNIIKNWPLEIDEKTSATAQHIRNKSRAFFRKQPGYIENKKGMIVIDYLGLMGMSDKNRVHAIGEISKALKALAMELKIPVIVLHQLNRGVEQRPDKRPVASDLRDSGELEEDMDHILVLYRDEQYNEDSPDKGIAELITRKNRTGPNNKTVRVSAQMQFYSFENLQRSNYN